MKNANALAPGSRLLLALEATVRLGTATLAAEHLNITQTAVSHRIHELEEALGQPLFLRHGRRLEPTPAAHILADAVRKSSRILQEALNVIGRHPSSRALTVSMLPALASKWLAPRLSGMLKELSTVDLRITASRYFVDFQRDRIDAAIRYGRGQWPGVRSRHLCDEWLSPVIAPDLLRSIDPSNPEAFAGFPLMRCDNPDTWEHWFETALYRQPPQASLIFFDEDAAMIEAAIAGTGVALGRAALVAQDIHAGRLIAPFGHSIASRFSYWFVQDEETTETFAHLEFYRWVKSALTADSTIFQGMDPEGD
jgi:LysR family transcriptional regulator, glycine cleavage system transcriptional activator